MWARAFGPGSSVTRCGASNPMSGSADMPADSTSRTAAWLMVHLPGENGPSSGWRAPKPERIESMQTGYGEYSRAGRAKRGLDRTSTRPLPAVAGRPAAGRVAGAASVDDGVALLAHELDRVVH